MPSDALQAAVRRLAFGESLSATESADAFGLIMSGEASVAQVAALLMALRVKGETADEVAGAAQAMRAAMVPIEAEDREALVDTCGTGGGSVTTFNISTAAALLAAGAGVRIAKHGNRSFTSRSGSADVLEALGVPLDATPGVMGDVLRRAGVVFMFAPTLHPAMRHVGPVRRELGIPTVMNIVGPLANPAGAGRQVVGVADRHRMPLLAGALAALGTAHALVVHGEPGMDEVSPLGPTHVAEVRYGVVKEWVIDPGQLGFNGIAPEDLAGGDPSTNARIIERVLSGEGPSGAESAVLLNAAAAIYVSGLDSTMEEALARAREALESGAGRRALDRLRQAYADTRTTG
ncbi:MAG TPA: anthranilate phosphoribosyltransferase [Gemmatimonadaceae bacterium]|nr:anthranilate phosphoribosyltransferase [Gemmatimonadaceae bacterium]